MKPLSEIAIEKIPDAFDPDEILPVRAQHLVNIERRGFIDGARYMSKELLRWRDASEKPDKNQLVLFECRKTYGNGYSVNFGENYELMKNVVLRWAYVKDLIPELETK